MHHSDFARPVTASSYAGRIAWEVWLGVAGWISMCGMTSLESAEPRLARSEVFAAGQHGVALYRIPGIVVTQKGTVLAYCEARRNSGADWGEIEVHLRRSTDGGTTWGEPVQIAHKAPRIEGNPTKADGGQHEQTVNNPVAIIDHTTEAIEFLYCVNYARCFSMRSTDDGVSWTEPVEITSAFEPLRARYDWKIIATGPGHGIQMATGRLVVPIWLAYGKDSKHQPSASATIFSDDHGRTWQAGEIAVPNEGEFGNPNETMITTLADGRVMLVTRSESKPNRKILSTSSDGASRWSTPKFHPQLLEPVCMASIIRHPGDGDGNGVLLFSNPNTVGLDKSGNELPGSRGKRQNLSIKLSRDDGATWPIVRTLEPGPSAYSDLAVLPDGDVLCLYESANKIVCARFNLQWVSAP